MVMTCSTLHSTTILSSGVPSTVQCPKQVWSWRLFPSVLELAIRRCSRALLVEINDFKHKKCTPYINYGCYKRPSFFSDAATVTGTIFGFRRGKVSFCVQTNPKSTTPELLLELAVPTTTLAREMKGGFLRIALTCNAAACENIGSNGSSSLLAMPAWIMFCNGRKVGFAVKRSPSKVDMEILQQTKSVVVGAGKVSGKDLEIDDDVMYLKAKFQRVHESSNSESFHLIDPDCNVGQELSFFFLRT